MHIHYSWTVELKGRLLNRVHTYIHAAYTPAHTYYSLTVELTGRFHTDIQNHTYIYIYIYIYMHTCIYTTPGQWN